MSPRWLCGKRSKRQKDRKGTNCKVDDIDAKVGRISGRKNLKYYITFEVAYLQSLLAKVPYQNQLTNIESRTR